MRTSDADFMLPSRVGLVLLALSSAVEFTVLVASRSLRNWTEGCS
jgi:hypothetical protein